MLKDPCPSTSIMETNCFWFDTKPNHLGHCCTLHNSNNVFRDRSHEREKVATENPAPELVKTFITKSGDDDTAPGNHRGNLPQHLSGGHSTTDTRRWTGASWAWIAWGHSEARDTIFLKSLVMSG
ncbi:hypothetical protein RRG08_014199 [Elysia crispata]|uniref:Uncharacterized protein n=1 Tax=Elysia crispata TaxID=231223 RepID=A0AAE1D953_9GAST|nr:hypothetical protein RRG08_014199 [Elysia crispata]